jgi:hypothetical protein
MNKSLQYFLNILVVALVLVEKNKSYLGLYHLNQANTDWMLISTVQKWKIWEVPLKWNVSKKPHII